MSCQHSIHISAKAKISVNASLVEFNFHKAIRVSSDNKVDFSPINHNHLFDVVHNIRKLLFGYTLHATVHLSRFELTSKYFILFNPL